MLSYTYESCNPFPANLCNVESYPFETGFIAFSRTSPQQYGPQREGEYQYLAMQRFAEHRGLTIAKHYQAIGVDGRCVGKMLADAIAYAESSGLPILAHDYERLCRKPMKLAKYPVSFVSLLPLASPAELIGLRKRAFNQLFPDRKGGRPKDSQAPFALPFILSQLGKPWSEIARELGDDWNRKKVQRTLSANFVYIDGLALDKTP